MQSELPRPVLGLLTRNIREEGGKIVASGLCLLRFPRGGEPLDTREIRIDVAVKKHAADIEFGMRHGVPAPKGCRLNTYKLTIDPADAHDFDIQNKLLVNYKDKYEGYVIYDVADRKVGQNKNGPLVIRGDQTLYLKQNIFNRMYLTVRDTNRYDYPEEQERIARAVAKAKSLKDKDIVYMYEKHCAKYEESASVLYEKLIDMGYDNVYFVTDPNLEAVKALPEKYKKNIIEKDSDKHLEYFFAADKFISTESIDHALQLRIASKPALDRITKEPLSYVFLQHGPTYMISLNKDLRSGFRKKPWMKLHKTVVSSELEAQHFIELGGMERDDLYITGMAKFDRAVRNEGADKIVIMPTWRRWELNQARDDLQSTNYYKMIKTMYSAVPDGLKEKVIILPHPLMVERFRGIVGEAGGEDAEMCAHILVTESYDSVLKDCEVLITDYSSISYDAYYRGAKVIFCWAEKDECMTHYGEGTKLMLNMDNVFGPVAMNEGEIRSALEETYGKEQDPLYLERYRKIIEFHDGKNSERIIEKLIEDGMLERKG